MKKSGDTPGWLHGNNRWGLASLVLTLPDTSITRGKKLVVVIGQRRALRMAASNNRTQRRHSGLLEALRQAGRRYVPEGHRIIAG